MSIAGKLRVELALIAKGLASTSSDEIEFTRARICDALALTADVAEVEAWRAEGVALNSRIRARALEAVERAEALRTDPRPNCEVIDLFQRLKESLAEPIAATADEDAE